MCSIKVRRREFDDPRTVHKAGHATKVIELILEGGILQPKQEKSEDKRQSPVGRPRTQHIRSIRGHITGDM